MDMSNVSTAVQMWNHVVMEQDMRSLPIGRKYSCEEEWWHSTVLSQKQKEQWRSYVLDKLSKESCPVVDDNTPREELDTMKESREKETWVEQVNEQGEIFVDKYLHTQCEFIRVVLKDAETSKEKREQ